MDAKVRGTVFGTRLKRVDRNAKTTCLQDESVAGIRQDSDARDSQMACKQGKSVAVTRQDRGARGTKRGRFKLSNSLQTLHFSVSGT